MNTEKLTLSKNLLVTFGRFKVIEAQPFLLECLFKLLIVDKKLENQIILLNRFYGKNDEKSTKNS